MIDKAIKWDSIPSDYHFGPVSFTFLFLVYFGLVYVFYSYKEKYIIGKPEYFYKISPLFLVLVVILLAPKTVFEKIPDRFMCNAPPQRIIVECLNEKCIGGFKISSGAYFCEYTTIDDLADSDLLKVESSLSVKFDGLSGIYESIQSGNNLTVEKLTFNSQKKALEEWENKINDTYRYENAKSFYEIIFSIIWPLFLAIICFRFSQYYRFLSKKQ